MKPPLERTLASTAIATILGGGLLLSIRSSAEEPVHPVRVFLAACVFGRGKGMTFYRSGETRQLFRP